jgi:hypothetical protein
MAYESTTVPVERSQGEIRRMLAENGAHRFAFGEDVDSAGVRWAVVSFAAGARAVRLRVPHKPIDDKAVDARAKRARTKTAGEIRFEAHEQEAKRIWRVIAWNLKARLVAVQEGVESFEEAFLAHLVHERTGRTVYEDLIADGAADLGAPLLPQLTAGGGS